MALDYTQSADLMMDVVFRGRVKVACLKFASFIQGEAVNTPAHTSRLRWAQGTYQSPDSVAAQVQPPAVMDPAVQTAGAAIADAQLQVVVEGVVGKFL